MSRVGRQQIEIPEKVTVEIKDSVLVVKGPKGELHQDVVECVMVEIKDGVATVSVKKPEVKDQKSLWGTYSSLLQNMVTGVTEGYEKKLEINGVGYNWKVSGKNLTVNAGYSHPVEVKLPEGIEASSEDKVLTIAGIDKQLVGEVAANIRKIRKPEPYKGSGIKYIDELIIRKAGKQVAGSEG